MDSAAALGAVAAASSILCQLVGVHICIQIVRKGGTELVSPVPFVTFFVSCVLWTKYGMIQSNNNLILTNTLGAMLQLIYICIYYVYTIKKSHFHRLFLLALFILFSPLLYVRYYQADAFLAKRHMGLVCCTLSVASYASPFASVKDVFRTKSTGSMSFMLVFLNFVAASCWFAYGALLEDSFVAIPNFLGMVLGLMQLSLFCLYPTAHHRQTTATPVLKL